MHWIKQYVTSNMPPREVSSVYAEDYNALDISNDASDSTSDMVLREIANTIKHGYGMFDVALLTIPNTSSSTIGNN